LLQQGFPPDILPGSAGHPRQAPRRDDGGLPCRRGVSGGLWRGI